MLCPGPSCNGPGTGELQVGDRLAVGPEAGQQDPDIEVGVVSDQAVITECLRDLGPEVTKDGFILNLLGGDSVDLDMGPSEVEGFGANHPHRLIGDFSCSNGDGRQLTGTVGSPAGRFKVDCREVGSKIHDFLSRHQIGVRDAFSVVTADSHTYPIELVSLRQFRPDFTEFYFSFPV